MGNWKKLKEREKAYNIKNENELIRMDNLNYKYTQKMCKTCKFYNNGCTKKRIPRNCADKGLKNKE